YLPGESDRLGDQLAQYVYLDWSAEVALGDGAKALVLQQRHGIDPHACRRQPTLPADLPWIGQKHQAPDRALRRLRGLGKLRCRRRRPVAIKRRSSDCRSCEG
ncbi:MAG TPA: hypothetical protein VJ924_07530, partial [Alphaproteobacteria bacterium]|nr:hypothetical protein [Alphaproteobacteria bacterium]